MAQSLAEIRELLERHALSPRHALGQNFLIDANLVRKLVSASNLQPGELVLEIGPGTGTLTGELLDRGARLVACELDRGMARLIRERFADRLVPADQALHPGQLTLIEGDALEAKRELSSALLAALALQQPIADPADQLPPSLAASRPRSLAPPAPFKLIANLPYAAATPIMLTLLIDHPECVGQFVTIQREVGERLLARPGSAAWCPLSALAQAACGREGLDRIAILPPECFWPRPEITSVMVGLVRRPEGQIPIALRRLDALCRVIFGQRRKQLRAILGSSFAFPDSINPTARAEALTLDDLLILAAAWQQ
jgi:16S rRNA (adenine1518-N6/adenine1519-N6)-dimethyltransferase